jgi:replicative DNA helicase
VPYEAKQGPKTATLVPLRAAERFAMNDGQAGDTAEQEPRCAEPGCGCTWLEELLQPGIDTIDAIAAGGGDPENIPMGITELDEITGGLAPGSLTVIGGYPGVGASTLALGFARQAAIKHAIPTAYLTLETLPAAVLQRVLSAEAKVKLWELRSGRMNDADWTRLARRMPEISAAPLILTRPADRNIAAIGAQVGAWVETHHIKFVVIDPMHLLTARSDLPYENREREVAEVARRLKALALDLGIAVVATAHLTSNPGPRQPIPPIPSLSDLRDSGTIAHVADLVMFVHRPDCFTRDDPRGGEADLIIAKHRHGPTATLTVAHQLHLCRFVDMAKG